MEGVPFGPSVLPLRRPSLPNRPWFDPAVRNHRAGIFSSQSPHLCRCTLPKWGGWLTECGSSPLRTWAPAVRMGLGTVSPREEKGAVGKKVAEKRIRVFLVDDHPSTISGLRSIFSVPDMEVVGEAGTGIEAVAGVLTAPPDVVVLDYRLPDLDGGEVLKRIRAGAPGVAVVILTAFEEPDFLIEAAMGGASGFLLKKATAKEVLSLIRRVASGENCLPKKHWQDLYARFLAAKEAAQPGGTGGLTPREVQVLECMARGLTNKAIAEFLGISIDTVRFHCTHLFERLGVSDRTQAVAQAIGKGYIPAPPGIPGRP